jgi:hypothetical protein
MSSTLPLNVLDFDDAKIRLVDQRGRLQIVVDAFTTHVPPCQQAQFPVNKRQQAVERRRLTPPPGLQQSSGVVRATVNVRSLHPQASTRLHFRGRGCTVATLKGQYAFAFTVSETIDQALASIVRRDAGAVPDILAR